MADTTVGGPTLGHTGLGEYLTACRSRAFEELVVKISKCIPLYLPLLSLLSPSASEFKSKKGSDGVFSPALSLVLHSIVTRYTYLSVNRAALPPVSKLFSTTA